MKTPLLLWAILLPFLTLAVQWLLWPWLNPYVWLLFIPTVCLSARLGGFWGGLLSTAISAALGWYGFIYPQNFSPPLNSATVSTVLFLLIGYMVSYIHERLRRSQQQLAGSLQQIRHDSEMQLQRYAQIVATSGDMLAFVDTDLRYYVVNPAYARLFGTSPEALRQRPLAEVVGTEIYTFIKPYLERALGGEPQRFVTEPICPDGQRRMFDVEYQPFRQAGELTGIVFSLRDITNLKASELKLKASEATLREAQRLSRIGNWQWDIATNSHYWSEEVAHIYGLDPLLPAVAYPQIRRFFTPESWARLTVCIEKCLVSAIPYECDAQVLRPDGNSCWVIARGVAIQEADGRISKLHGTIQNITQRKQAEEWLRESEEKFRNAFANAAIGFSMTTIEGGFMDANPAYCTITGYTLDELRTLKFSEIIHPDDVKANMALLERMLAGQISDFVVENRYRRKDGEALWVRKSVALVRKTNGDPQWYIALVENISNRKQAEAQLQQLNADLERRVLERTAALTTANRELDSFVYAVSHDLRAPLRALSGFSDALLDDYSQQLPNTAKDYLQHIRLASQKMSGLIDGLLNLSRCTRRELQQDTVYISALAEQVLAELQYDNPERQVSISIAASLQVQGDARMLEAVMRNLLSNAWKYTAHTTDANIRVYSEHQDGKTYFCVADNGAGFDMANAQHLFQPFQRLHSEEEFAGLGIGLATVQRIIDRHGGVIDAQAKPGKGAVFRFSLNVKPSNKPPPLNEPEDNG
jgi:PAS domain S-box-containing protein